jgi:hypothetical protein
VHALMWREVGVSIYIGAPKGSWLFDLSAQIPTELVLKSAGPVSRRAETGRPTG